METNLNVKGGKRMQWETKGYYLQTAIATKIRQAHFLYNRLHENGKWESSPLRVLYHNLINDAKRMINDLYVMSDDEKNKEIVGLPYSKH